MSTQNAVDQLSTNMTACGIAPLEAVLRTSMREAREQIYDDRLAKAQGMIAAFLHTLRLSAKGVYKLRELDRVHGSYCDPDPAVYQLAKSKQDRRDLHHEGAVLSGVATMGAGGAVAGFIGIGLATGGVGWGLGIGIGVASFLGTAVNGIVGITILSEAHDDAQLRRRHAASQGRHGVEVARQLAANANKQSKDCEPLEEDLYIPKQTTTYHDWINYTEMKGKWEEDDISEGIPGEGKSRQYITYMSCCSDR
eukprot:COSAG06_NODE_4716_length_4014_cov_1.723116_3_plen_252_part_00